MTFVCDSAAPGGYYFSERALKVLSEAERVQEDALHNPYLQTDHGKFAVTDTPHKHQPVNIIGLRVLEKYGLLISEIPSFQSNFRYF